MAALLPVPVLLLLLATRSLAHAPKLLTQPVGAKFLLLAWKDTNAGVFPAEAFHVRTGGLGTTWRQGEQSWLSPFGDYWQANNLDPGSFLTTGWSSGPATRYDQFTAKVLGWHFNGSHNYGPPLAVAMVVAASGPDMGTELPILARPLSFELVASVNTTQPELHIWRPIAPVGYTSLGDVVSNSSASPPDSPSTRVVHNSCVTPCGEAFALWSLPATKGGQAALSVWGARAELGSGDVSGGQFRATNISVS
eukprot:COSAG05_NODE_5913_length_1060_cov_1.453694_1_plen_250_part_10